MMLILFLMWLFPKAEVAPELVWLGASVELVTLDIFTVFALAIAFQIWR